MKMVEWKADPLYVLKAELDSITADMFLRGFNPSTKIRLENLSQRIEEQALWRGDKTGYVRLGSSVRQPHRAKLTLRFDEPTKLSEEESTKVQEILDDATGQLERLLGHETAD